jgi:hypothetical protein
MSSISDRPTIRDGMEGSSAARVAAAIMLAASGAASAATLYVDDGAPAGGDGTSWASAYRFLQDALTDATGGGIDEIRVGEGIQRPDRSNAVPGGTGSRLASFQLVNGVAVRGGYAGFGAASPDDRDVTVYATVLSGDLAGDDGPGFAGNAENARHVTTGNGTNATALLDGVTVIGGNAVGGSGNDRFGGGMLNISGAPTITDCIFTANRAEFGGGLYSQGAAAAITFVRTAFVANAATQQGGGLYTNTSGTGSTFESCRILGNQSGVVAGGVYFRGQGRLTNCLISGNASTGDGGGLYVIFGFPVVTNCTIASNSAPMGGGIVNECSGSSCSDSTIRNTIAWGNAPDNIRPVNDLATVSNSLIEGGWLGTGSANLSSDPLFAGLAGADLTIGTLDDDGSLTAASPAIDAGSDAFVPLGIGTDLEGGPRIVAGTSSGTPTVDIGAVEFAPSPAPTADAAVEQLTDIGTEALVRLDGSASSDPDDAVGDLTFEWTVDDDVVCSGDFATCATIEVLLAFGAHDVTLRVTDPEGSFDELTSTVVLDPAQLSVFEPQKAKVAFASGTFKMDGEIGLPFGVNYTEVGPVVAVELLTAGAELLPGGLVVLPLEITGARDEKWRFRDDAATLGIRRLDVDWSGARFHYDDHATDVTLKSSLISTTETVITVNYKMNRIGGAFAVDFGGLATLTVDAAGVASADVPLEVEKPGHKVTLTLPFPITDETVITISGAQSAVIDAGDHLKSSIGRFHLVAEFDAGTFPAGSATEPRTIEATLLVGAVGYPGFAALGPAEIEVVGDKWSAR